MLPRSPLGLRRLERSGRRTLPRHRHLHRARFANEVEVHANFTRAERESLTVRHQRRRYGEERTRWYIVHHHCAEEFSGNRPVALTASPVTHHELIGWSGCDSVPSPSECKVTMSQAKVVSVTFAPIPQLSLSVAEIGTGQGAVTSYPPGISCPATVPHPSTKARPSTYWQRPPRVLASAASAAASAKARRRFARSRCPPPPKCWRSSPAPPAALPSGGRAPGRLLLPRPTRTAATGALLTVKAPEAGTLFVSGSGLRPTRRGLSAGTSRVRVALVRRARRVLSAHHHLRLRISIGFLPSGGGAPAATAATLRFRSSGRQSHSAPPQPLTARRRIRMARRCFSFRRLRKGSRCQFQKQHGSLPRLALVSSRSRSSPPSPSPK